MGERLSPNPNLEGTIYTLGDGDYSEGIYQNLGTLDSNGFTLNNNYILHNFGRSKLYNKGWLKNKSGATPIKEGTIDN